MSSNRARVRALGVSVGVLSVALGAAWLATLLFHLVLYLLGLSLSTYPVLGAAFDVVPNLIMIVVCLAYFALRRVLGGDLDGFARMSLPSLRQIGAVLGGVAVLFAIVATVPDMLQQGGVQTTGSEGVEQARKTPVALLVKIPVALFFVGPAEELLLRGTVQDRLAEAFPVVAAIFMASILFAIPHYLLGAYQGRGVLGSLIVITITGWVLGAVYEYTGNLLVVMLIHGLYDAAVYMLNFVDVA